jgi:hypothetical protein
MIKVDSALVLEFEINGAAYRIDEPSVKQVRDFINKSKASDKDDFEITIDFIVNLGLPKDVANSLTPRQLKTILNSLVSELSEKK